MHGARFEAMPDLIGSDRAPTRFYDLDLDGRCDMSSNMETGHEDQPDNRKTKEDHVRSYTEILMSP